MPTCKYCAKEATQTLIWLFDKNRRPARIKVPWCGCDLLVALKKFWLNTSRVAQGIHYEVEALPGRALLPELTPTEKAALTSLPHDYIKHLLAGKRAEFNPNGTFKCWRSD